MDMREYAMAIQAITVAALTEAEGALGRLQAIVDAVDGARIALAEAADAADHERVSRDAAVLRLQAARDAEAAIAKALADSQAAYLLAQLDLAAFAMSEDPTPEPANAGAEQSATELVEGIVTIIATPSQFASAIDLAVPEEDAIGAEEASQMAWATSSAATTNKVGLRNRRGRVSREDRSRIDARSSRTRRGPPDRLSRSSNRRRCRRCRCPCLQDAQDGLIELCKIDDESGHVIPHMARISYDR